MSLIHKFSTSSSSSSSFIYFINENVKISVYKRTRIYSTRLHSSECVMGRLWYSNHLFPDYKLTIFSGIWSGVWSVKHYLNWNTTPKTRCLEHCEKLLGICSSHSTGLCLGIFIKTTATQGNPVVFGNIILRHNNFWEWLE